MLKRRKKRRRKRHKDTFKVGWASGKTLGLAKGHYVFIRKVRGNKCDVNTFTSITSKDNNIVIPKVKMIQKGIVYPIPKNDTKLKRFSGIHKRVIKNVPLNSIRRKNKSMLKGRHYHYILKYMK